MSSFILGLQISKRTSARTSRNLFKQSRRYYPRMSSESEKQPSTPLNFNDGPLVWIDCEMTGLDPSKDKIIEIAVLITNGNLDVVDSGIEYVIRTDKKLLNEMDSWCIEQHGRSGLTQACLDSPHTSEFVADKVLEYIKKWVPSKQTGVLAGNSVHADRMFLTAQMPAVIDWLHYRIVDVSSIKELSRRWYAQQGILPFPPKNSHRALDDIIASIEELQWYRQNIFVAPSILQRSIHLRSNA